MALLDGVADAISGVLGLGSDSWKDRLKEAAYTAPGGTRVKFAYEDVGRETSKRTTAFEFPGVSDAYVQDNGHGPRRYPLRCFFWGDNHDLIATAFEAALLETGIGKLEHPLYGSPKVVPFGDITRRDDLKNAANQTIVEVTFMTSIGSVYPSSQKDAANEILAAIEGFNVASANQFSNAIAGGGAISAASIKSQIRKTLQTVSAALSAVSGAVTSVDREFRDTQSLINLGLDVLIGQPLLLARQCVNLTQAPARALTGIRSRLDAYKSLLDDLLGTSQASSLDAAVVPSLRRRASDEFATADMFAMAAVSGSVLSTVEHTFSTRPEALAAAEDVLARFAEVVEWREERFGAIEQVDPGDSYQALHQSVALVAGYLTQISFTLVPERRIVLDRARTIVDLAAELYGSVDDRLDFLISSNNLSGSEILEIPRGRTIVYYP